MLHSEVDGRMMRLVEDDKMYDVLSYRENGLSGLDDDTIFVCKKIEKKPAFWSTDGLTTMPRWIRES
jgi:hypothetical protein